MSNLRKILRALNHCEEWREMIEAAAMIVGKEVTRDLQVQTTFTLADQIVFNEDTLEVDVSGVKDGDVLEAVLGFEEAQTPETATPLNAQLEAAVTGLTARLLEDTGRGEGKPWEQPAGAHDAYPKDWICLHDGKTWESLVPFNVWAPGVSGWREIPSEGSYPEWTAPTGAHDAWKKGDQVAHKGSIWVSDINGNVWEPGVYGWTLEDPQDN